MKIVAISDMHGYLKDVPECDLLLIAGDILPLRIQFDMKASLDWLEEVFIPWAERQQCEKIVFIAGNHDAVFDELGLVEEITDIFMDHSHWLTYLENESIKLNIRGERISIFGTPYCKMFGNWSFMLEDEELTEVFKNIPDKVDIILSHDAPYGTSDVCSEGMAMHQGHIGNKPLAERLKTVDFKLLFHGHLHSSNHEAEELNNGLVYNVSILDEEYSPKYEPLELEWYGL